MAKTYSATHRIRCMYPGCKVYVQGSGTSEVSQQAADDAAELAAKAAFDNANHEHAPSTSGSSAS